MSRLPTRLAKVLPLLATAGIAVVAQSCHVWRSATAPSPWRLTWHDEFNGSALDSTHWDYDLGSGWYSPLEERFIPGWGNDEMECYTNEKANATVRRGVLRIRALSSTREGCRYTSARIKSRRTEGSRGFTQQYGRFEFRAKLPSGQGLWPALWMLPQDESYGTWASSGEIDVMEAIGRTPNSVVGTLHFGGPFPANTSAESRFEFPAGTDITDFHVYALEWEPGALRWLVDGRVYGSQTFWWSSSTREGKLGRAPRDSSELNAWPAPFNVPFYLIMNLAVGGKYPGNPDITTRFPAEMVVDYVRVYARVGGDGTVLPRGEGMLPFEKFDKPTAKK